MSDPPGDLGNGRVQSTRYLGDSSAYLLDISATPEGDSAADAASEPSTLPSSPPLTASQFFNETHAKRALDTGDEDKESVASAPAPVPLSAFLTWRSLAQFFILPFLQGAFYGLGELSAHWLFACVRRGSWRSPLLTSRGAGEDVRGGIVRVRPAAEIQSRRDPAPLVMASVVEPRWSLVAACAYPLLSQCRERLGLVPTDIWSRRVRLG